MEERSLRVYQQKSFFSKIGTTISKILVPTKIGFNGVMISVKRNNLLKAYEAIETFKGEDTAKKEQINKKYEDVFALYLESIDKYIMDSIYKKVKNGNALPYEEEALSKYYMITHLKENQYLEYKYRKQKYLMELDYESIKDSAKEKIIQKYNIFYVEKMDVLYKGILKNYSVQLADNLKTLPSDKVEIYDKIFETVEEYVTNILTIKMNLSQVKMEKEILEQYDKYSKFLAGKHDTIDILEKKMVILALSRKLFTHSVPLIIAEQCYEQLLNEARSELVHAKNDTKTKKAYKMLLTIMEEYNVNLLSTKIYWDKPKDKDEFKKFWDEYKKIDTLEDKQQKKEVLFLKSDLNKIEAEPERYKLVIKVYKEKLVELGAMKKVKDKSTTKEGKLENKKTKTNGKKEVKKKAEKPKKEVKKEEKKEVKQKTTRTRKKVSTKK